MHLSLSIGEYVGFKSRGKTGLSSSPIGWTSNMILEILESTITRPMTGVMNVTKSPGVKTLLAIPHLGVMIFGIKICAEPMITNFLKNERLSIGCRG
jgi:hypothetical protein